MATKKARILIKRGNKVDLPALLVGELGVALDTGELFVGTTNGNKLITGDSGDNSGLLREVSFDEGNGVLVIEKVD